MLVNVYLLLEQHARARAFVLRLLFSWPDESSFVLNVRLGMNVVFAPNERIFCVFAEEELPSSL